MKTKLKLAHDYALAVAPHIELPMDKFVELCFDYAEAMLAENARREDKSRPEVLQDDFEVDWSQAPASATHWTMKKDGVCLWWKGKPLFDGSCFYDVVGICHTVGVAPSFNYTGDWKESLRRRPE